MKCAVPRPHPRAARVQISDPTKLNARRFLWLMLLFSPVIENHLGAAVKPSQRELKQEIETLIHDFSARLGISQRVEVEIVPENPRLVSVAFVPGRRDLFRMSFEEGFLRSLHDVELRAAVAHEMGHIWIYTHFPFLQTEVLANQQALKLVAREELARAYAKMWAHNGEHGSLTDVLGPEANAGLEPKPTAARPGVPGPEAAVASAPAWLKVFIETATDAGSLTGVSGTAGGGTAPAAPSELTVQVAAACPECRLCDSRDDADYILTVGPRLRDDTAPVPWTVYTREGILVDRGSSPMAGDSAQAALRALLVHIHATDRRPSE